MSILLKLFGWTGLTQRGLELTLVGAVAAAISGGLIHIYEKGKTAEKAKILKQVQADADKMRGVIVRVETERDDALKALADYRASHPVGAVQLCVEPSVRKAPAPPRPASAAPGSVQQVPAGDSGSRSDGKVAGPDISGLLEALAARADEVSEQLRARQKIEP